jgi:hypothetical protein
MSKTAVYEFDQPKPGESLEDYLRRHHCHPDDESPRQASDADEAAVDKTHLYKDQAFTITKK